MAGAGVKDVTLALRDISRASDRCRRTLADEAGLQGSELVALGYLYHDGPKQPRELSAGLQMTSGAVTALVDRLSSDQLVERRPGTQDRRTILVSLTDRGTEMMECLLACAESEIDRSLSELLDQGIVTAEDLVSATRIMHAIAQALTHVVPHRPPTLTRSG